MDLLAWVGVPSALMEPIETEDAAPEQLDVPNDDFEVAALEALEELDALEATEEDERPWDAFAVLRPGDVGGLTSLVSRSFGYGDRIVFDERLLEEVNARRKGAFGLEPVEELAGEDWALVMQFAELGDPPSETVGHLRRLLGLPGLGGYDESVAEALSRVCDDSDFDGEWCETLEWKSVIAAYASKNGK